MKFDTVIIGGGLAGIMAGIRLQGASRQTAIVSAGQNALHFFSGSFESLKEAPSGMKEIFSSAGIDIHYEDGVRLMPLGSFREAALSLGDVSIFEKPAFAEKVLIVNLPEYHDFFASFIAEGFEKQGITCSIKALSLPELKDLEQSPSEMRSVQIARIMDRCIDKVIKEIRLLLCDEDAVVLPQVFGLKDASIPGKLRREIPAKVVFAGTLPPSVPGIRTQMLLKRHYESLGGIFFAGDEVLHTHVHEGVAHSVATRNMDSHYLEASSFILATGSYFSKGLRSNPFGITEPLFGLDVEFSPERSAWYNPSFKEEQPYMNYGVTTDASLHGVRGGEPMKNVYAIGSVLGGTRSAEFGTGAGLAVRTALAACEQILSGK